MKYVIALDTCSDFVNGGDNFIAGEKILYLGEIENMRGHCCVLTSNGKMLHGIHTDNFYSFSDDHFYHVGCLPPKLLKLLKAKIDEHHVHSEKKFVLAASKLI